MTRAVAVLALALLLVACVPAFEPRPEPAPGVTLTATPAEVGTLYRVDVNPPVTRLLLLFVGRGLAANAPECAVTPTEIRCSIGAVQSFYEITIAGEVTNTAEYGVACRDSGCWGFTLTE